MNVRGELARGEEGTGVTAPFLNRFGGITIPLQILGRLLRAKLILSTIIFDIEPCPAIKTVSHRFKERSLAYGGVFYLRILPLFLILFIFAIFFSRKNNTN